MNTITVAEAKQDLESLIIRIISNVEPIIVRAETGEKVVLVPMEEFTAWQETAYLLANPTNAAHLRESIAEANAGKTLPWAPLE